MFSSFGKIGQKHIKVSLFLDSYSSALFDWNISGMQEDNHICLCKEMDVISQHFYILTARCLIKITINQTNWLCFVLLRCSSNERSVRT